MTISCTPHLRARHGPQNHTAAHSWGASYLVHGGARLGRDEHSQVDGSDGSNAAPVRVPASELNGSAPIRGITSSGSGNPVVLRSNYDSISFLDSADSPKLQAQVVEPTCDHRGRAFWHSEYKTTSRLRVIEHIDEGCIQLPCSGH